MRPFPQSFCGWLGRGHKPTVACSNEILAGMFHALFVETASRDRHLFGIESVNLRILKIQNLDYDDIISLRCRRPFRPVFVGYSDSNSFVKVSSQHEGDCNVRMTCY